MFREYELDQETYTHAILEARHLQQLQERHHSGSWKVLSHDAALIGSIGQAAIVEYLSSIIPWADLQSSEYVVGEEIGSGDTCDLELLGKTWDVKAQPVLIAPNRWFNVRVRQSQADRKKVDGYFFVAVTKEGHYWPLGGCLTDDLLTHAKLYPGNYGTPYYQLPAYRLLSFPDLLLRNRSMSNS